jgi:hypothetical protein
VLTVLARPPPQSNPVSGKEMALQTHSILADLALRLAKSPEDVATEGLAYVLSRSTAARACVQRLAGQWAPVELPPIVLFQSQAAKDGSRPDIEAYDAHGKPVLIFENKFWAGLTPAQPIEYLQRLAAQGGVLCFVAPQARLPLLWPELFQRATTGPAQLRVLCQESDLIVAHVGENRSLVLTSWPFLLGHLSEALEAHGDLALVADIRQLIGLAARMDTSGFIPFSAADLTAPTARHILQFCDVVNGAVDEHLLRQPFASIRGLRATGGTGWFGRYVRLHGIVCFLSFDAPLWAEHGRSPIWLRVTFPNTPNASKIEQAIAGLLEQNGYVCPGDVARPGVWLPLPVPEGRERDAVIGAVADEVLRVANVLRGIASPDAPVETPPEAEGR